MKGLRLQRWGGQLLSTKSRPCCAQQQYKQVRNASRPASRTISTTQTSTLHRNDLASNPDVDLSELPSPLPETALTSAKLAALHARLNLPKKLPLQTLSRTLIDPTADSSLEFNNTQLATLGRSLLAYYVSEWLITTYPRLPMLVLHSATRAYAGPATLTKIGQEWGVETAAYPGGEVDPGLLQFAKWKPGQSVSVGISVRPDALEKFRRGISSRVVYDDEFGDLIPRHEKDLVAQMTDDAYAGFVRALTGAVHLHGGSQAAKSFISAHILSRHLPLEQLFEIKTATRDLARLCARENFSSPVARLLSETGRASRHPVFVVGIFCGSDKLGEGSGASLDEARTRAAIAALKAWYLYSPTAGRTGRLPSDVEKGGEWKPLYIDIGEIVV